LDVKLRDKVAVVTGSARGIGWEIARAFADEGAIVAVCDLRQSDAEAAVERLEVPRERAIGVQSDVSVERDVVALAERVGREFGRLDIWVNNAGFAWPRSGPSDLELADTPFEIWRQVVETNLGGAFLGSREAVRIMRRQGSGSIINISSNLGLKGQAQALRGPYCASKFGIEGLTEVLALENRAYGIRANTLRPGFSVAAAWQYSKPNASGKRMLHPGVLRPCAVFLASDDAADVTGQALSAADWNARHGHAVEWVVIP
jgi:NAD(P)-dependent dehydrogenase (short-subunit alcohol dehydrogenase family)